MRKIRIDRERAVWALHGTAIVVWVQAAEVGVLSNNDYLAILSIWMIGTLGFWACLKAR